MATFQANLSGYTLRCDGGCGPDAALGRINSILAALKADLSYVLASTRRVLSQGLAHYPSEIRAISEVY